MAPADDSIAGEINKKAGIAKLDRSVKPRSNIVVSFRPFVLAHGDAAEFCERELKALLAGLPGKKVGATGRVNLLGTTAATADVELRGDAATFKQFHALLLLGGQLIHFVATATPGDFDKLRPSFVVALGTLDFNAD
jgi:hypothetical protein